MDIKEYHVQDNEVVTKKDVKMFFDTTQCNLLRFIGPHIKSHGVWGFCEYYHNQ